MPHSVLSPFVARFTEILATHPVSVMIWQRLSGSRYGMKILPANRPYISNRLAPTACRFSLHKHVSPLSFASSEPYQ